MIWSSYILPYTTVNYVVPNFYCNQYNLKLYQLFLYLIPRSYIPSYPPSIIGPFIGFSTQFLNKNFINRCQIVWRSFCIDPFYDAQNPISKHISKCLAHMFLEISNFTVFQRKDGRRQQVVVLWKPSLERAAGLSQWPAQVRGCSPLVKEWQEGAKIKIQGNIFRHKVTSPLL